MGESLSREVLFCKEAGRDRWVVQDEAFLMLEGLPRFPEVSFHCGKILVFQYSCG